MPGTFVQAHLEGQPRSCWPRNGAAFSAEGLSDTLLSESINQQLPVGLGDSLLTPPIWCLQPGNTEASPECFPLSCQAPPPERAPQPPTANGALTGCRPCSGVPLTS